MICLDKTGAITLSWLLMLILAALTIMLGIVFLTAFPEYGVAVLSALGLEDRDGTNSRHQSIAGQNSAIISVGEQVIEELEESLNLSNPNVHVQCFGSASVVDDVGGDIALSFRSNDLEGITVSVGSSTGEGGINPLAFGEWNSFGNVFVVYGRDNVDFFYDAFLSETPDAAIIDDEDDQFQWFAQNFAVKAQEVVMFGDEAKITFEDGSVEIVENNPPLGKSHYYVMRAANDLVFIPLRQRKYSLEMFTSCRKASVVNEPIVIDSCMRESVFGERLKENPQWLCTS